MCLLGGVVVEKQVENVTRFLNGARDVAQETQKLSCASVTYSTRSTRLGEISSIRLETWGKE